MALLFLQATPIDGQLPSPAEQLLGRQVQDNLPKKIKCNSTSDVISRLQEKQVKQKYYHDQHVRSLSKLVPGPKVTIENPRTFEWEPAVVEDKIKRVPRSYSLSTPSGAELRRYRYQIQESTSKRVRFNLEENQIQRFPKEEEDHPSCCSGSPAAVQENGDSVAEQEPEQYRTRSGRAVKPPSRMDL